MALNFSFIPEQDFSKGIDQHSAETQVQPGYVEDALNMDIEDKRLVKRPGFEPFAGCFPFRVEKLTYDQVNNQMLLFLSESIDLSDSVDLSKVLSVPLVIYGKTSLNSHGGDFTSTSSGHYYSSISTDPRVFLSGADTLIEDIGLTSKNYLVGVTKSDSPNNYNNTYLFPDKTEILDTTFDIQLTHTIAPSLDPLSTFVYYYESSDNPGSVYNHLEVGPFGTGSHSFSIPAGTHNLNNFNIMVFIKADNHPTLPTGDEFIQPDSVVIDTAGEVTVSFTNSSPDNINNVTAVLISVPSTNLATGSFTESVSTQTINIPNIADPFAFFSLYEEDTGTGDLTLVIPQAVRYVESTQTLSLDVIVGTPSSFKFFYDFGYVQTNIIKITPTTTITSSGTDESPQMTLWGIPHDTPGVYGTNKIAREGWMTHLDSYRSQGEERLVAGLGGFLCSDQLRENLSSAYKVPQLLINLRNRVGSSVKLGPLFRGDGETYERERGYVNSTNGSSNWVEVTDIEYQTSGTFTGYVKYTLNVPGKVIEDKDGNPTTLASVVSTVLNFEDQVTVEQCGHSFHNGTFTLKGVEDVDASTIAFYIENTEISSTDYDETDVGGRLGIFTDHLPLDTDSYFLPGDRLLSDLFEDQDEYLVLASTTSTLLINSVTSSLYVPVGLRIYGQRTSCVIPLREADNTPSVENFVTGDTVFFPFYERAFNIERINTQSDISVTVDGDSLLGLATVTLGSGSTNFLAPGQKVNLLNAGPFSGTFEVIDILSTTEFSVESTSSQTGVSGVLQGKVLCVGESVLWNDDPTDTLTLTVERRWIPIETPEEDYIQTYYFPYRDFFDQDFLRSSMSQDNLYLTNGLDPVQKYDGVSLYRAGLPRFQLGLFTSVKSGGGIPVASLTASFTSYSGSTFTVTAGEESKFREGDRLQSSTDLQIYTVTRIDETNNTISVDKLITGATTGTLTKTSLLRYYVRLNSVDLNGNVLASAAVGYDDLRVEFAGSSTVELKMVGFPKLDNYNFSRLEASIYRNKVNSPPDFFRVATLPISYDSSEVGYFTFSDTTPDEVLFEADSVHSALLGGEVGGSWTGPLRAKYLTSAGNKLVLANIRDYPQVDLTVDGSLALNSAFNGKIWQFEREFNSAAPTVTDNLSTVRFETRNTGDLAVSGVAAFSTTHFDVTIASTTGILAGDWIYLFYKGTAPSDYALQTSGWWQVDSVESGTVLRIKLPNTGTLETGTKPNRYLVATDPTDIPVYLNDSTSSNYDSNYQTVGGQPTSGPDEKNVMFHRLANAINSTQRVCQTTGFTPWLLANSDGTYPSGNLIVRQPKVESQSFYFRRPSSTLTYSLFANQVLTTSSETLISSQVRIYPSRLLVSYQNFPEIFDNPTAVLAQQSDSVIDVNPADGQEITGVIPFYGDSAFGTGQKEDNLVVFKSNSIYLVNLANKALGLNDQTVKKLETRGLGCTAPYSITVCKDSIFFANESGIYRINRADMSITHVGQMLERIWKGRVDKSQMEIFHGHHYALGESYKLSVVGDSTLDYPDEVLVYHHSTEEGQGSIGGWTRYDSHQAIGWANLASDAFFCNTAGRVLRIRNEGSESDYRDLDQAITSQLTTRALDFGAPGIRKLLAEVITQFRTPSDVTGTSLTYSYDMSDEFLSTDPITLRSNRNPSSGIGDQVGVKSVTLRSALNRKKAVYFQIRYQNDSINQPLDVAGFTVRLAGLTEKGIKQAVETV